MDAPLASALAGAADDEALPVFIQVDRSQADAQVLDELGLGMDDGDIGTTSLSAAQVAALTDQAWVQRVQMSGRLRMLRQPGSGGQL